MTTFPLPSQPVPGPTATAKGAPAGLRRVLVCLTMATGLVDAACYLGMGHVLVANMTGNVVFLGFALGGAKGFSIASFLVALGSFLAGAAGGGRLGMALGHARRWWLVVASATETALAATAAIATAAGALGPTGGARFVVIALLGLATGLQNATIRRLAIPDLTTTVLTLTLTGLAADSSLAGGNNPHPVRRLSSAAAMLAGGVAGGALMVGPGFTATLAVLAAVFAAITVGFALFTEERVPPAAAHS
jgi:uncharacterized membrane protein YoaK (UPF0700 family)